MGCHCCRMIKRDSGTGYIYDPSAVTDGRKSDSAGSSVYQPHHLPGGLPSRDQLDSYSKEKHGFHNLGYSKSNDSTLKLEVDNNALNHSLHAALPTEKELHRRGAAPTSEVYIIQPEALGPRWVVQERGPSQVPVYPDIQGYSTERDQGLCVTTTRQGWDGSITACEGLSVDEIDEGVGGTPEYPCDTGDEGSVLSVDIHTSTTSLSSGEAKDELRAPKTPDVSTVESGISVMKSEDEEDGDGELHSVTDSMVAEALAALEAATAGEDFE